MRPSSIMSAGEPLGVEVHHFPQQGVTMDPGSGTASVPNAQGGVKVETKPDGSVRFIFEDTLSNREAMIRMLEKNGLHAKAAELQGREYKPGLGRRLVNRLNQNLTGSDLMVTIGAGLIIFWAGRKLALALARSMGWNLFGNTVGEEGMEERRGRAPRRASAPTQPQATA